MSGPNVIVVAPAHVAALYEGRSFDGVAIGKVTYEAAGVDGRRGYVSHPFDEDRLREILQFNGHLDDVSFVEAVPSDWRWPDLGFGTGGGT